MAGAGEDGPIGSTRPMVGEYRLLEPLGRGGMGVVHLAVHARTGERVALKTVAVASERHLQSIRREIHTLSLIRHPGIVRIVDEGSSDGVPWYAMELLGGLSLDRWSAARTAREETVALRAAGAFLHEAETRREMTALDPGAWWTDSIGATPEGGDGPGGSLRGIRPETVRASGAGDLPRVLTIVRRLCSPLGFLHGEGIVHRDLKPENVLVRPDGMPVIVDFGLSLPFGGGESREVLTVEAGMAGTAHYMAPEQIRGELVDARADIYALGCILYELVTGRKPFPEERLEEILRAHLTRPPVTPSRLAPDVPAELDRLVLRLLAKHPADRLGYAEDVARELARLGAADGLAAAGPRPRVHLYRPGLFGRAAEMEALSERIAWLRQGSGGVVLVGGESGVGKTRLAAEVAREAIEQGVLVLAGECHETPAQPLQAFRKPLQAIADRCRERGREETERLLGRRGRVLAPYAAGIAGLPGEERYPAHVELEAGAARLRLLADLVETIGALAREVRVLLILDDLQWADPMSVEVLSFLSRVEARERGPLLVLGLYRTEEVTEDLERLLSLGAVEGLQIGRLGEGAVAKVVAGMLALETPPETLGRYVAEQSEGNPLFVAEYLRLALENGVLSRGDDGEWRLARPLSESAEDLSSHLPLPRSLRDLVRGRLDALDPLSRGLVEAAAVLGRGVEIELLSRMVSLGGRFLSTIGDLLRRHVMVEQGPGEARLAHDKIREVAYSMLGPARRAELHRLAAGAIERLHAADLDPHAAELAHHYGQAGDLDRERKYSVVAGRRAAGAYANAEAIRLFSRSLDLTPEDDPAERYDLHLARQGVHDHQGTREAQGWDVAALEGLAETFGDDRRRAEAALRRANLSLQTGSYAVAGDAARRAIELAKRAQDPQAEAEGYLQWGATFYWQGEFAAAREKYAHARELARRAGGLRGVEARCLRELAGVSWSLGEYERAQDEYVQALALYRASGDRAGESRVLGNLGNVCLSRDDPAPATRWYEEALRIFVETGDRQGEAKALAALSVIYAGVGDLARSRAGWERGLLLFREIGDRHGEAMVLSHLGEDDTRLGEYADASGELDQSLRLYQEIGDRAFEGWVLTLLGRLFAATADLEAARQHCERGLELNRETGDRDTEGFALTSLGHVLLAQGRVAEAGRAYRQGLALRRALGQETRAIETMAGLARVALLEGDPEGARRHATEILEKLETLPPSERGKFIDAYLAAYEVLAAVRDSRARDVLDRGHQHLVEWAARIEDDRLRGSFLENVRPHRDLMEEWERAARGS